MIYRTSTESIRALYKVIDLATNVGTITSASIFVGG